MLTFVFGRSKTPAELEAVHRLCYQVCLEELGPYRTTAYAASGRFAEPFHR